MAEDTILPCQNCGFDLGAMDADPTETTALVDVTPEPVFAGRRGQREVPAYECPECGEVTPL